MQKISVLSLCPVWRWKCVVWLLDFCLSKLSSKPPAIYELWDLWLKYLWIVRNSGIAEVELKSSIQPELSEEGGLYHSNECMQNVPWKVNSGHKSLNALRAYERTSSVQEKAASECIHLGKQYDRIVSKRRSLLLQNASVPEGFQITVQQFSELQNCTTWQLLLKLAAVSNPWTGIWNETVIWKMEWNGECTQ